MSRSGASPGCAMKGWLMLAESREYSATRNGHADHVTSKCLRRLLGYPMRQADVRHTERPPPEPGATGRRLSGTRPRAQQRNALYAESAATQGIRKKLRHNKEVEDYCGWHSQAGNADRKGCQRETTPVLSRTSAPPPSHGDSDGTAQQHHDDGDPPDNGEPGVE